MDCRAEAAQHVACIERELMYSMNRVLITNPRSGTHYLKSLIASALGEAPVENNFATADELHNALSSVSCGRLIYGHLHYSKFASVLDPGRRPDLRLIVLTRHPLDRLISQLTFERAVGGMLPDPTRSPPQLARELLLGKWDGKPWKNGFVVTDYAELHNFYLRELVTNWRESFGCHFVIFEDLIADPSGVLTSCLDFLEAPACPEKIRSIIGSINFYTLSNGRRPGQCDQMSHYRNGIPGKWRQVFTQKDLLLLRPKFAAAFRAAGHDLWPSNSAL
jgi:hypothetical protein